jgi:hypothetical protein
MVKDLCDRKRMAMGTNTDIHSFILVLGIEHKDVNSITELNPLLLDNNSSWHNSRIVKCHIMTSQSTADYRRLQCLEMF